MAKFYKKEEPTTPLMFPHGKQVQFEVDNPRDYGYLRTEDGWVITELTKCISEGRGGIVEITEEEYLEWQKKRLPINLRVSLQQRRREEIGPIKGRNSRGADAGRADIDAGNPPSVLQPHPTMVDGVSGNHVTSIPAPQKPDGLKVSRDFVVPKVGRFTTGEENP